MDFEFLPSRRIRNTAAAALLLICAANTSRFFSVPMDSIEASSEANVWASLSHGLDRAGYNSVFDLSLGPERTFSFSKGQGSQKENCMGYYQPKTKTYSYIGAVVCDNH